MDTYIKDPEFNTEGIDKIYFDMDGVLADFNAGIRDLGVEPVDINSPYTPEKAAAYDRLFNAMRNANHFFRYLKPIPDGVILFTRLRKILGDRVAVLTGIPSEKRGIVDAVDDKRIWVDEWLGADVEVIAVPSKEKKNYCKGQGYALIDDSEKNVREWIAAGGSGFLFKQPEPVHIPDLPPHILDDEPR